MTATKNKRQIHLAAFMFSGQTTQSWRHPDIHDHDDFDIDYYIEYAKTAEAGLFDTVFVPDTSNVGTWAPQVLETMWSVRRFEPLTLMTAVATHTKHIGLTSTISVSDHEPTVLARQLASLDHISRGRAGWNIVTTPGAGSGNLRLPENETHDGRYDRAREFYEVVSALWDTWEDDAFLVDKARGVYVDTDRFHRLDHDGPFYRVKNGALITARPPQGRPLIVQAGGSPKGRDFGAQVADAIFCSNLSLDQARAFRTDMRHRAALAGRDPDLLKILSGTGVIWGRTKAEAEDKFAEICALHPIDVAVANLLIDFTGFDLDDPFPEVTDAMCQSTTARAKVIGSYARSQGWTIRQAAQNLTATMTHRVVLGDTASIADQLQEWFEGGGVDGFVIMSPYLLGGLRDFVAHVVPELQRRGLYRTEYEGSTLRDSLGLPRPANRYAALAKAAE